MTAPPSFKQLEAIQSLLKEILEELRGAEPTKPSPQKNLVGWGDDPFFMSLSTRARNCLEDEFWNKSVYWEDLDYVRIEPIRNCGDATREEILRVRKLVSFREDSEVDGADASRRTIDGRRTP